MRRKDGFNWESKLLRRIPGLDRITLGSKEPTIPFSWRNSNLGFRLSDTLDWRIEGCLETNLAICEFSNPWDFKKPIMASYCWMFFSSNWSFRPAEVGDPEERAHELVRNWMVETEGEGNVEVEMELRERLWMKWRRNVEEILNISGFDWRNSNKGLGLGFRIWRTQFWAFLLYNIKY